MYSNWCRPWNRLLFGFHSIIAVSGPPIIESLWNELVQDHSYMDEGLNTAYFDDELNEELTCGNLKEWNKFLENISTHFDERALWVFQKILDGFSRPSRRFVSRHVRYNLGGMENNVISILGFKVKTLIFEPWYVVPNYSCIFLKEQVLLDSKCGY